MKYIISILLAIGLVSCNFTHDEKTAAVEQELTEKNQQNLLNKQPPPKISWSLERDNLIKRFKLMNDRAIVFYMYVFIEGVADPIGYYQVNKVSSVNSQLTNTEQVYYYKSNSDALVLPSPAEDGSYGTNGDGVFGFTPEDVYIEHNLHYIVSTIPLSFKTAVQKLVVINVEDEAKLKQLMDKIR